MTLYIDLYSRRSFTI